ncbi:MAG: hypothetical protein GXP62_13325 [Oligoflexia bacterium]|nr:hypothetical protein [Oligoflexia bacterium]
MITRSLLSLAEGLDLAPAGLSRAVRLDKDQPVLVRFATMGPQDLAQRSRLRNELALLESFPETPGLLRPVGLIDDQQGLVLVLPDPGGVPLSRLDPRPSVDVFLRLALGLARTLDAVHRAGAVHAGIDPDQILVDGVGGAWLLGFGDSVRVGRESLAPVALDGPDVRLACISPEQTGRMNRVIDERTDLYSLGIVLYQYLTGTRPLVAHDAMGWVHAHTAARSIPSRRPATARLADPGPTAREDGRRPLPVGGWAGRGPPDLPGSVACLDAHRQLPLGSARPIRPLLRAGPPDRARSGRGAAGRHLETGAGRRMLLDLGDGTLRHRQVAPGPGAAPPGGQARCLVCLGQVRPAPPGPALPRTHSRLDGAGG